MKNSKVIRICLIVLGSILLYLIVPGLIVSIFSLGFNDKYEITTDINMYNDVIGSNAINKYKDKWNMSEKIFPKSIKDLNVENFKMVYYDPFDKQYLSYLVINYEQEDYDNEISRLKRYGIEKYVGYYGVTGFSSYKLLAMNSDSYNGFVYAITDGKSKIIYVELIFCNYYMDIKYNDQIPKDYLPDNFDATIDNKYKEKMLKEK